MKKIIAAVLVVASIFLVSCGGATSAKGILKKTVSGTTGMDLYYGSADGNNMAGFRTSRIDGIASGAFAAPKINALPFIAYVFRLDGSVGVEEFKSTLCENCDLVWNICTSADTVICESEGDVVLFVMLDMDEMTGLPAGTDEKIINNFHSVFK